MIFLGASLSRVAVLRIATAALAVFTAQTQKDKLLLPAHANGIGEGGVLGPAAADNAAFAVLPLRRCGGAFCAEYLVDGARLRAVVDTGSPFLLVDGSCGDGGGSPWGCYRGGIAGVQGSLNDASEEGYGGQEVGVQWRRGRVQFPSAATSAAGGSARLGKASRPGDLVFEPLVFGVVKSYTGKGGAGAIYMGLVKDRQLRIRPTLLEQTDVQGLRFDFVGTTGGGGDKDGGGGGGGGAGAGPTLTLSRRPLIPKWRDAVRLVDLRTLGAPLGVYACEVRALVVNGRRVQLLRPCVAVLDTGTTGLSISTSLYDSDELPMPGAAMREVTIELSTEKDRTVSLSASANARRKAAAAAKAAMGPDGTRVPNARTPEIFDLVVTPVDIPWFDDKTYRSNSRISDNAAIAKSRMSSGDAMAVSPETVEQNLLNQPEKGKGSVPFQQQQQQQQALERSPHVIFVGLSFLSLAELTIDTDTRRMTVRVPHSTAANRGTEEKARSSGVRNSEKYSHEGWKWKKADGLVE